MSLELHEGIDGNAVQVKVTGKLTSEDYRKSALELDQFIREHGKIRMIFDMHDFHGWALGGMWQDFRFGFKHRDDLERLAVVGEARWQRWSSRLCNVFAHGQVRYFDRSHADEAMSWVTSH